MTKSTTEIPLLLVRKVRRHLEWTKWLSLRSARNMNHSRRKRKESVADGRNGSGRKAYFAIVYAGQINAFLNVLSWFRTDWLAKILHSYVVGILHPMFAVVLRKYTVPYFGYAF
uniref:7TM GPCR serpentine receptor class x (Srx) domain-containing protein n=1 Tax=Trichuris muris TaxID=70415 RepID=A0A5S6Q6H7_TRIMR